MSRAGKRNRRLLLQRRNPTVDAEGNVLPNWTDVQYVWAEMTVPSVLAASGARGEREQAGLEEQLRPHTITLHGTLRNLVDHNSRFLLGGNGIPFPQGTARVLDVRSTTDLGEQHHELRVQAMERIY